MKNFLIFFSFLFVAMMSACGYKSGTDKALDSTMRADNRQDNTYVEEYYDIYTNAPVRLKRDTITGYFINAETGDPITYIIRPASHDTFDARGRNVNNALIKQPNGGYLIDESKMTEKKDDEGLK